MISHIHVVTGHFQRALSFYKPLMAAAGPKLMFVEPKVPLAGWKPPGGEPPLFL